MTQRWKVTQPYTQGVYHDRYDILICHPFVDPERLQTLIRNVLLDRPFEVRDLAEQRAVEHIEEELELMRDRGGIVDF